MHEQSLISDLIKKIETIALENNAPRVVGVKVKLGALCHISPEHFREHFAEASMGTIAEGAVLDMEFPSDASDPHAQEILLLSVDVQET